MAWLLVPGLAMGHARFVAAVPGPGEVLDSAPASLVLEFSESVQPVSVQILDADGVDVAAGALPRSVDTTVELEFVSALPSGRYVVSYRVLSGDAHPIAASYEFSVQGVSTGVTPRAPSKAVSPDGVNQIQAADWEVATIVTRAAYMLGFLLTTGGALFLLLVPVSGLQALWQRATLGFALYTLLAALAYLQISGANMLGVVGVADFAALKVAAGSSLGLSLGIAFVGLLGVLVARARPGFLLISALLLLVCSRLVTGHPAVREPAWLLVPAMAVHVSAASFWYGSLAPLFVGLGRLQAEEAAGMVARFARVAMAGVALLAIAGILMAFVHLAAPSALLSTWYGQLLIMKTTWFSVLLGLAAWHKLSLTPRLAAGDTSVVRRLRISIVVEAVVMTLVVLISVNLASTAPEDPASSAASSASAPPVRSITSLQGDYRMQLDAAGLAADPRSFDLAFSDPAGSKVMPLEVAVTVGLPALGVEPLALIAEPAGDGNYRVSSGLPIAGRWRISVDALITDFDQRSFVGEVLVN